MSISRSGFHFWKQDEPARNAMLFATSFLYERIMLGCNDAVVSILGKNLFFPNKPKSFHTMSARYARAATTVRLGLWYTCGWKSLLFLYLSETLWSIPPHPACAMFVTNHGSGSTESDIQGCIPSKSTYAGRLYSIFTLGTNYHCEHHDFPTIPFHKLRHLHTIAPEYYPRGDTGNVWRVMKRAFARPEFYACMDAGNTVSSVR